MCKKCNWKCVECDKNICTDCLENRSGTECKPNDGFYENNDPKGNNACHYTCFTCNEKTANNCLKCGDDDHKFNRHLNNKSCIPNEGYFDPGTNTPKAIKCQYTCKTCNGGSR